MAEKRMFSKKITDDDNFISMPSSAQALYFHLNQGADDDGFNNQLSLAMFKAHASEDDMKQLEDKNFIIRFDNGVIVIKHWLLHNTLRKDRYKSTQYQMQFQLLSTEENGVYTLGCQVVANRLPNGCHSIEKESIVKNSLVECSGVECSVGEEEPTPAPTIDEITDYILNNNLSINPNRFFFYYDERDWKSANGKPIKWQQKLQEWDFEDKQKAEAEAKAEPQTNNNPFLSLLEKENLF